MADSEDLKHHITHLAIAGKGYRDIKPHLIATRVSKEEGGVYLISSHLVNQA